MDLKWSWMIWTGFLWSKSVTVSCEHGLMTLLHFLFETRIFLARLTHSFSRTSMELEPLALSRRFCCPPFVQPRSLFFAFLPLYFLLFSPSAFAPSPDRGDISRTSQCFFTTLISLQEEVLAELDRETPYSYQPPLILDVGDGEGLSHACVMGSFIGIVVRLEKLR